MLPTILPIVEGQSEVHSVPLLLRRLIGDIGIYDIGVARPFRVKRNKVVRSGELERALAMSIRARPAAGAVLVLLDADDDCPAELGPSLLERCREATPLPTAVVLANRELESWFLGAKESLRGLRGIRPDARIPDKPESIRGAKERLSRNMEYNRYIPVDDQPALVAQMDLEMAKNHCPSFRKLARDVAALARQLDTA